MEYSQMKITRVLNGWKVEVDINQDCLEYVYETYEAVLQKIAEVLLPAPQ